MWVSNDRIFSAETCHLDIDLGRLGYTKSRWTAFLGSYVGRQEFIDWLGRARTQEAVLQLGGQASHKRGPCVLAILVRHGRDPRLVLYSRTGVLPTRASLELSLCSRVRDLLGLELGFTWFISSLQWWPGQFIPLLASQGRLEGILSRGDWLAREMNRALTTDNYQQYRRLQQRAQEMATGGVLEPLPVAELPFIWRTESGAKTRVDLEGKVYRSLEYPENFTLSRGKADRKRRATQW